MTGPRDVFIVLFAVCFSLTYLLFFRRDIARWWRERGPRRQLAREAAAAREAELARLRDELAAKYLADDQARPPQGRA